MEKQEHVFLITLFAQKNTLTKNKQNQKHNQVLLHVYGRIPNIVISYLY